MVLLDNVEIREKNTGWSERNGISKEPRGTAHKAISSDTQKKPYFKKTFFREHQSKHDSKHDLLVFQSL